MKKISDAMRSTITSLLDDGLSSRQIASRVKVNHCTVDKIHMVYHPGIQKLKEGRKARLSTNDKKHIMHIWRSGEVEKAPEIIQKLQEETGRDFSHDTISCVLKEAGLKAGCKKKKPRLLPYQKKVHRDWVYTHKNWSTADWECVIWSDETIIERLGSHRRKWV